MTVDANGRYVLVIARADLPKVASNNRTMATPEESQAIVQGSIAHFGTVWGSRNRRTKNNDPSFHGRG